MLFTCWQLQAESGSYILIEVSINLYIDGFIPQPMMPFERQTGSKVGPVIFRIKQYDHYGQIRLIFENEAQLNPLEPMTQSQRTQSVWINIQKLVPSFLYNLSMFLVRQLIFYFTLSLQNAFAVFAKFIKLLIISLGVLKVQLEKSTTSRQCARHDITIDSKTNTKYICIQLKNSECRCC